MSNVIVVGGGAAGMMAAVFAARNGQNVQLLEKNEKLGKKLFITGKGGRFCEIEPGGSGLWSSGSGDVRRCEVSAV